MKPFPETHVGSSPVSLLPHQAELFLSLLKSCCALKSAQTITDKRMMLVAMKPYITIMFHQQNIHIHAEHLSVSIG